MNKKPINPPGFSHSTNKKRKILSRYNGEGLHGGLRNGVDLGDLITYSWQVRSWTRTVYAGGA